MNWPALFKAVGIVAALACFLGGLAVTVAIGGPVGGKIAFALWMAFIAAGLVWILYQGFCNGL